MDELTLPDRRTLYLLNPAPTVLTPAELDAMDREPPPAMQAMLDDEEGHTLVQRIHKRKEAN